MVIARSVFGLIQSFVLHMVEAISFWMLGIVIAGWVGKRPSLNKLINTGFRVSPRLQVSFRVVIEGSCNEICTILNGF